jgi:anti-sigma regulatory factor (Ser/Thr protein kinase)
MRDNGNRSGRLQQGGVRVVIVWKEQLDDLPDKNKDGISPVGVLRDATRKEAQEEYSHSEVCDLVVAVSEATSNGLLHGSSVVGTIARDHKKIRIEVANSKIQGKRDFDCTRGEDTPLDEFVCHHRGLQIAKELLTPIGGALRLIKNGKTVIAIIEIATKPKPTG